MHTRYTISLRKKSLLEDNTSQNSPNDIPYALRSRSARTLEEEKNTSLEPNEPRTSGQPQTLEAETPTSANEIGNALSDTQNMPNIPSHPCNLQNRTNLFKLLRLFKLINKILRDVNTMH